MPAVLIDLAEDKPADAGRPASGRASSAAEWHESIGCVPLARVVAVPPALRTLETAIRMTETGGRAVEWVNGNLVEKAMGRKESRVAGRLITALNNHVLPQRLGEVTGEQGMLRMADGNMRMPDVAFTHRDDFPPDFDDDEAAPRLPATIAAEVLSPGNMPEEIRLKLAEFFASSCRLAWVIDPRQRVVRVHTAPDTFRQIDDQATLDGGDVLPGFGVKVADLLDV